MAPNVYVIAIDPQKDERQGNICFQPDLRTLKVGAIYY